MEWTYVIIAVMYLLTFASAWVCTMATTMGWTTNGKFDWKGWFMEFKSFLIPLWIVAIMIFVLAPYCFL